MARRHLTMTLTISLDADLCETATSAYQHALDALRTTAVHDSGALLAPFDPIVTASVSYHPEQESKQFNQRKRHQT